MSRRMRPAEARKGDFEDIFLPQSELWALGEASRCLGCHDAPCTVGCAAGVDVRAMIQLVRWRDIAGAAEVIRRGNVFGASCARLCGPEPDCRASCLRARIDAPLDIPELLSWVLAEERRMGPRPLPTGTDRGRSVAIVGGGPAGLAAAAELRRLGHRVVLFEASDRLGGLLTRGIPPFRLPRSVVEAEIEAIVATGVDVRLESPQSSVDELLKSYDAVILATGFDRSKTLGVDGEDLEGVYRARDLLAGQSVELGPRPVVIGGGMSAVDAAAVALRSTQPEGRVAIIYRRAPQQMPAFEQFRQIGIEEGVVLRPLTVVERILGDRDGRVAALRCRAVDLGPIDSSGRPGPMVLSGGTFDLTASSVIVATGDEVSPELLERFKLTEAEPRADEHGRTEVKGLYVAGDLVGGPRSVAWAVGSGVRAARAVEDDLRSGKEPVRVFPVFGQREVDLSVELFGRRLVNPFLLAASPATEELERVRAGLRAGWAGAVLRTTSIEGTPLAPKHPSIAPIGRGATEPWGLGNLELISEHHIDVVEARVRQLKEEFPDRFIAASIMADSRTHWQRLARQLAEAGVDAIECSLAAPQGTLGSKPGAMLGQDAALVRTVTRWVRDAAPSVPVMAKLTLQVADVAAIAKAVADGGGAGVTAMGSIPGLAGLDVESGAPQPSIDGRSSFAGVTGRAIRPFSLRGIAQVAATVDLPVLGCGGVESWEDAAAMILLGATGVQVCTAVLVNGFDVIDGLTGGLARWMERQGVESLAPMIGASLPRLTSHGELRQSGPVRARVDEDGCVGCGRCYVSCHDGARDAITWDAEARLPKISLERCNGCGLCVSLCPVGAISQLTLGL